MPPWFRFKPAQTTDCCQFLNVVVTETGAQLQNTNSRGEIERNCPRKVNQAHGKEAGSRERLPNPLWAEWATWSRSEKERWEIGQRGNSIMPERLWKSWGLNPGDNRCVRLARWLGREWQVEQIVLKFPFCFLYNTVKTLQSYTVKAGHNYFLMFQYNSDLFLKKGPIQEGRNMHLNDL